MNRNLLALAMSLALLLGAAAHAQTTQLKVTVPFDFTAGNVQLPAGEYDVTAVGPWGGIDTLGSQCEFERRDTRSFQFLQIAEAHSRRQADLPSLRQQYFLAEVWNRHNSDGNQLQISSQQTELVKNQSKDEVVLIASQK